MERDKQQMPQEQEKQQVKPQDDEKEKDNTVGKVPDPQGEDTEEQRKE